MSWMSSLLDFALFQLAWFACVTQAAAGQPARGAAAVAAFVLLRLARSDRRAADLLLLVSAPALGLLWDTALLRLGLVQYASPGPVEATAPGWILALWMLLAAVLRGPLRWLQGRPLMAAALGAVGGPASYAAAQRLGACWLPEPALALSVLCAGWALITPLLVETARQLGARVPGAVAAGARA